MWSKILNLGLLWGSIYLFYQFQFFFAVILLVWLLIRVFGYSIGQLAQGVTSINIQSEAVRKANIRMQFSFMIERVLAHPKVDKLYESLHKKKLLKKGMTKTKWKKAIEDNYCKKYDADNGWCKVIFNVKNGQLWKDEKISFIDDIYHEIYIPYAYKKGDEDDFLSNERIESGLTIRILIVNGILKLQVGNFSRELTPEMLDESEWTGAYRVFDTITEFPLMYFSYLARLPKQYLGLSMYATDSYWNLKRKSKKDKDFTADWHELNKEIRDYEYVCNLADEYIEDSGKWEKIVKVFEQKKDVLLKKEKFENLNPPSEYYDRYRTENVNYSNDYLNLYVTDFNELKGKREQFVYPDYYEESPL